MANYITTWICIDSKEDASYFPSSKGLSSDLKVQAVYWKCVVTFFCSVNRYVIDEKLVLFTNTRELPEINGVNVKTILEQLGVSIRFVEFNYKVPKGYFNSWTNQFFEFSILDYISENFDDEDNFLMLDSDCLFLKKVNPLFEICRQESCLTYLLEYPEREIINGISRVQMKEIYQSLLNKNIEEIPQYHAGEFLMASVKELKKFATQFHSIWPLLLKFHDEGKPKLVEEAHVLSYIYYINGFRGGQANEFIKRIWTDPTTFRNVEKSDVHLAIWHVPAEKKYGIENLFQYFKKLNFNLSALNEEQYKNLLAAELSIPTILLKRKLYYGLKKIVKRFLQRS